MPKGRYQGVTVVRNHHGVLVSTEAGGQRALGRLVLASVGDDGVASPTVATLPSLCRLIIYTDAKSDPAPMDCTLDPSN